MRDKANELRKKGFESVKFFAFGGSAGALVPNAEVLSFEDLFTQDIGFYMFEEPVLKIKSRKNREFASMSIIFASAILLSVFSIFVFNGLRSKTAKYNLEGRRLLKASKVLRFRLKTATVILLKTVFCLFTPTKLKFLNFLFLISPLIFHLRSEPPA